MAIAERSLNEVICNKYEAFTYLRYEVVMRDCRLIEQVLQQEMFRFSKSERFSELTDREVEVLQLLAGGLNNPAIGKSLLISRSTVETHRKHLNKKLSIKSYNTLVKYALAYDLLEF